MLFRSTWSPSPRGTPVNSKKARGPQTASPEPSPERLGRGCKRRMRSRDGHARLAQEPPPPPRLAVRLREASGHLRGWFGVPWNASLPIWRYRRSGRLLQPASPRFATACGAGSERRQSAVPQARAMPCWRACGPARWGRRSSYGNGFAIFPDILPNLGISRPKAPVRCPISGFSR